MIRTMQWALAVLILAAAPAQAQYPDKSIRIINPFPAGSPVDFVGRLVADRLNKVWGVPVLVESRPGAGGTLAANFVAKSAPDGYTLLVTTPSTLATAPALYKSLPYDPIQDFAPIWSVTSAGLVVVVNPDVPAKTLSELAQYARENPGKLSFASSGFGTTQHLAGELFMARTGVKLVHVPYRGGAPATTDLMGGQVNIMFDALSNVLNNVRSGRLRALAVLRAKRARALPDVPTAAEASVPGVEQPGWIGLFAPSGTPPEILNKLVTTVSQEMSTPEVVARLVSAGNDSDFVVGQDLARRLAADKALFAEIVKEAGIQPE
jgi:tripartite-type tricarboxylate transporter receptor subunit TctC